MKKIIISLAIVLNALAGASWAAPTLGYVEDWTVNPSWESSQVGDALPTITQNTGSLVLTLPNSGNPGGRIYATGTSSGGNFTGNYAALESTLSAIQSLVVQFNLASLDNHNTLDGAMMLYFVGNGNTYYLNNDFTQPSPASGSVLYRANIGTGNWIAAGVDQFATDFANVTQFGLELWGSLDNTSHRYQLDNFEIAVLVPEPETVWMILMVLASMMFTFRSRLAAVAGQIKARIRA